jgi:hypothetical protein
MGEIDQVDDAVHHGIAQRYQGIHAAEDQTVEDLLQQNFHRTSPFPSPAFDGQRGTGLLTRANILCGCMALWATCQLAKNPPCAQDGFLGERL